MLCLHITKNATLIVRDLYIVWRSFSLRSLYRSFRIPIQSAGLLDTTDQLMPYLTTFLFTDMPGVSAVYVSGAFAGALSTVSSNLSSMSNVFVNDFLHTWTHKKSEKFQIALRNEFWMSEKKCQGKYVGENLRFLKKSKILGKVKFSLLLSVVWQ